MDNKKLKKRKRKKKGKRLTLMCMKCIMSDLIVMNIKYYIIHTL